MFSEHYFHLQYENLLEKPLEELHIWGFLGVGANLQGQEDMVSSEMRNNPDADGQKEVTGEMTQVLKKGRYGNWMDMFPPRDIQIFDKVSGDALDEWGYKREEGSRWGMPS